MTRRPGATLGVAALTALALVGAPAAAAVADDFGPPSTPPRSTTQAQQESATPASDPTRTCRLYGSSSGFGMLCSDAAVGKTLAQVFREAGIDVTRPFCWDDPELPDGYTGPENVLYTCLSFEGGVVSRGTARLTYEFRYREPGTEEELGPREEAAVRRVTGRGQIPYLQVQTSPVSSPRVEQEVAFSLLCSSKVVCSDTPAGRTVETPRLRVGGLTIWAELVHTRVQPEGSVRPGTVVDCTGAGLPLTAEELDRTSTTDPRVCRHRYDRSSNEAGSGSSGDRYPARVTAYWQIWYDDGRSVQRLGETYEKSTTNAIRVTEVQTLVVT